VFAIVDNNEKKAYENHLRWLQTLSFVDALKYDVDMWADTIEYAHGHRKTVLKKSSPCCDGPRSPGAAKLAMTTLMGMRRRRLAGRGLGPSPPPYPMAPAWSLRYLNMSR
jgi:hypothetical protein